MGKIPMKRRWMILMSLFVLSTAIGMAQKVNLNFSQTNLRTVLEGITQQTNYTLAFSKEVVDLSDAVTIRVTDTDLKQVLDQLLTPRNIGYELRDNKIYIFEKPLTAPQAGQATQQDIRLSGRVIDENGDPVIGANIAIPGTAIGTISDADGNFSLTVQKGATIRVSYIGYLEQQITITNQTALNVLLQEDTEQLEELVVIGYGVQRKSVVTAAISRVTAEELNTNRPSRVEDALKGKVSGVQITQSSGQPGSDSKVRIRGIGTVNNSNPLFIVDGMEVGGGIDYLNPIDIQSVEILKDAASAAIYGTRGANGVVLVTTKSGTATRKPVVNYDMTYGWQNPWRLKQVLNATEYMILMNENKLNDGNAPIYSSDAIKKAGEGTNWQKETFNYNAPVQNHQVSVNGGNQQGSYFLSFGYFKQDGIVGGNYGVSNFERYSIRSNSNYQIFETKDRSFLNKMRVGVNVGYSRTKSTGIDPNSEYGSILGSALGFDPTIPVYAPDDATANQILADHPNAVVDKEGRVYSVPPGGFQELANPVAFLNRPRSERGNADKIVGTFFGEIDILPSLKFRSSYGVDLAFWGNDGYEFPHFLASQGKNVTQSSVWSEMNRGYKWQIENYFTWTRKFADLHNLTVIAGQSAMKYTWRQLGGSDYDLLELDPNKAHINSAVGDRDNERVYGGIGGIDFESLASYFGRIDYGYGDRYMAQITLRRDGSSKFGPQNKWGLFPAVSLGYNLMNEPFMEDIRPDWFDILKLRFSYGRNGNDNIGNLRYAAFIDSGQSYYFGGGYNVGSSSKSGTMQDGQSPAALPNAFLGWEKSEQTDIGFDAYFSRNRLSVGFDYFKKKTIGMLMDVPIPGYVGQGAPVGNVGTMENNGIEIELGWKQSIGDFNYFISANASYMKNRLVKLGNESGEQIYESAGASGVGDFIKGENGEEWPFFYGYKTNGLFQNQQEIDTYVNKEGEKMQPDARPGDVRFVDYNQDGIIDDKDRTKIGKGAPDWTFGTTLGAEYKNFDLNLFFQGVTGNDIFDFATRGDIPSMNRPIWTLDRWHGEGTSNKIPRMTERNLNRNWRSSDLFIKDGSYLRLKTAQLGYTLPAAWTKRVSIQKLRMFVSGENLLTFTKYQGYDPEISTGEYTRIGVDRGGYPQARNVSVGVNISF